MPELPEVETVRRGLAPVFCDASIVAVDQRRADLRFPFPRDFVDRLVGRRVDRLERRAKYLVAGLDDDSVLIMHLGMSGSFRIEPGVGIGIARAPGVFHLARSAAPAHDHVVFEFSNGARVIYNDPRRFGFMTLADRAGLATHPFFARLGVEPLAPEFDGEMLARRLAGRSTPLKAALLDQTLVAGLGNIYVCEALHRSGLSPHRAAGTLVKKDGRPTVKATALACAIRDVLLEAVEAGGSSLRDHRQADGTLGYFQHRFRVYDREGAACTSLSCRGTVQRIAQYGRSTFFCATCQK